MSSSPPAVVRMMIDAPIRAGADSGNEEYSAWHVSKGIMASGDENKHFDIEGYEPSKRSVDTPFFVVLSAHGNGGPPVNRP